MMELTVWICLLVLGGWRIGDTESSGCPYDFAVASQMIPTSCYVNNTAQLSGQVDCCWFAFASFVFAISLHANQTGEFLLDGAGSNRCADEFMQYLRIKGLVPSTFFTSSTTCQIDPLVFTANMGPCKYARMAQIWEAVNLHNASMACNGPNLNSSNACDVCQNEVINAAMEFLNVTNSKEIVPCGVAVTVGLWGTNPKKNRFESFLNCITQVLQNVGALDTSNHIVSPPPPAPRKTAIVNPPAPRKNPSEPSEISNKSQIRIAVSAGVASAGVITAVLLILIFITKLKNSNRSDDESTAETTKTPLPTEGLYIFTTREIRNATAGFEARRILGQGGSAKVYLGNLPSGKMVAIKRIVKLQKRADFYREVQLLSRLRHPNLTALLGYCNSKNNHILVYEFMAGGDLSDLLYQRGHMLPWDHRLRIALDCAEGLNYLHLFPDGPVIHRDVKPRNILLNSAGQAKLADFGISRLIAGDFTHVTTEVKGTTGYLDPEYFTVGQLTEASDVYSFGVVLLELISGQKAIVSTPTGGAESIVYATHVFNNRADRDIRDLVDPRIGDADVEAYVESIEIALGIASLCVRPYRSERPSMVEVLAGLYDAWNKANDVAAV